MKTFLIADGDLTPHGLLAATLALTAVTLTAAAFQTGAPLAEILTGLAALGAIGALTVWLAARAPKTPADMTRPRATEER